jgi:hypothetical protein
LAAAVAALFLAGCFTSEKALFDEDDAVVPIADGGLYELRSSSKPRKAQTVRITRIGRAYAWDVISSDDNVRMRVMLVSIIQTPDDDYIAQISIDGGTGDGFAYAFLWPLGDDRYRIFLQSDRLDETGKATFDRCGELLFGCSFDSADDLRSHYLEVLYPMFSRGRWTPNYTDMRPLEASVAPGSEGQE